MAHHGSEMSDDLRRRILAAMGGNQSNGDSAQDHERLLGEMRRAQVGSGLGATGQFPRGKLAEEDEGEIKIAIAADPKSQTIIIDFGKPTAWIGFTAEQAIEIAETLQAKAWELRGIESK
jgi:hypothetical protein